MIRKYSQSIFGIILGSALALWPISFGAVRAIAIETVSHAPSVSLPELEQGIADRLKRVEEFKFIEQESAKLGVRAWLFGGTAAGYAHYVKWDMQREKGDPRFQKDRFDYDYTNVYRSTQDLDIVIDGNPEQAQKLQNALQGKYPHLQGSKSAWEVRLLTQDMGDKQAILNNPDFMNQHTDSNSTGMIEITKPHAGESVVRDVRDWKSKEPHFLKDVHDGALHYYFSPLHETTQFAKAGRNPPILSAIRFLTKAFQYELKVRPEDLERIKKVIQEFDPELTAKNDYVAKWIEKNGKKLIQNAVNIEYAWNTLEQLGLRSKLQAIKNNPGTVDSLAWWMNKEPLRTSALGQGSGKTARELGLDILGHETNHFLAYESITRAHTGDSNVLISRGGVPSEGAAYGNGFYTKVGREGARGTGLTIRFRLDPNAREGEDFIRIPEEDFVVIKNKAAIKVIPESLSVGPVEFFEILAQQKPEAQPAFAASDLGIVEKLKRRIGSKIHAITPSDLGKILSIVKEQIPKSQFIEVGPAVREWFSLPISVQYPELVDQLIQSGNADTWVAQHILSQPQFQNHPEWVRALLAKNINRVTMFVLRDVLSKPHWQNHPELVESLLYGGTTWQSTLCKDILSAPHWKNHPEWVDFMIERGTADVELVAYALGMPHWQSDPKWTSWIETLMKKGQAKVDAVIVQRILTDRSPQNQPFTPNQMKWIEELINRGDVDNDIASYVLASSRSKDHPEWMETLLRRGVADSTLVEYALSQPHWKSHPKWAGWIQGLLSKKNVDTDGAIARVILTDPISASHPEWVEELVRRKMPPEFTSSYQKEDWRAFVRRVQEALEKSHWRTHPELQRMVGKGFPSYMGLLEYFEKGGTLLKSPAGSCIPHQLNQLLK